jgi:hypothetical protein
VLGPDSFKVIPAVLMKNLAVTRFNRFGHPRG